MICQPKHYTILFLLIMLVTGKIFSDIIDNMLHTHTHSDVIGKNTSDIISKFFSEY
jgi:hypothetical protein